jgi:hypothetical protein
MSPKSFQILRHIIHTTLEGFRDLKIAGQVTSHVKYADTCVLLAKEEMVLQGITDRVIEVGRCYGMEINVENLG